MKTINVIVWFDPECRSVYCCIASVVHVIIIVRPIPSRSRMGINKPDQTILPSWWLDGEFCALLSAPS
jgi:hypothetical protein